MTFQWTDEIVTSLRREWQAGKSSAIIARQLGVTRNMVIGKVHRLDLAKRKALESFLPPSKPKTRAKRVLKPAKARSTDRHLLYRIAYPKAPVEAPTGPGVSLMERTGCCFPVNSGSPFLFCNEKVGEGSYCEYHKALMYRPWVEKASA